MRSLSDSELIQLWEGGMRRHLLDRALLALSAALPETPFERLADWPLGRRNSGLAELRCSCFGPSIKGWIACTSCGEKLEFALDGQLLTAADRTRDELSQSVQPEEPIVVKRGTFRLPTSRDLAKADLPASLRQQVDLTTYDKLDASLFIDGAGQLRRLALEMKVSEGTSAPVTVDETLGFSDFGAPVQVATPGRITVQHAGELQLTQSLAQAKATGFGAVEAFDPRFSLSSCSSPDVQISPVKPQRQLWRAVNRPPYYHI